MHKPLSLIEILMSGKAKEVSQSSIGNGRRVQVWGRGIDLKIGVR